jgi:2-polyprenyl-3-methyl-5-hydroxy-6-metoxy-1,4-benzoquinol methylase
MHYVRRWLDSLNPGIHILDAGCGEGVLVEEYGSKGLSIEGIDLNYASMWVHQGDILCMPYEDRCFDVVLLLDVFEHLAYADQPKALQEIGRVLKAGGRLLMSVPNLAHLNSRVQLFLRGKLDRTDIETNHPGERPISEYIDLLHAGGFHILHIRGITLTIPLLYHRIICRQPERFRWLHDWLDRFAVPSIAMVDLLTCSRDE